MEAKITLYNADGTQIGETFSRRARQLVKQQRAVWVDDDHTAIRFNPDPVEFESDWEDALDKPIRPAVEKHPEHDPVYVFAKKKLKERRRVILHLWLLIPEIIGFALFASLIPSSDLSHFVMGMSFGTLLTANGCNVWYYYDRYVKDQPINVGTLSYWQNRREIQLAAEVEKLRRMGYGE